MELPIQIIVVLFVALVVGGAIIAFSQNTLRNAQQNLIETWKNNPANKDDIITVSQVTDDTLKNLAVECVKKGYIDKQICFVIIASSDGWKMTVPGSVTDMGTFQLDTTGIGAHAFNTLVMSYDPSGKVLVTN